jgi:hypothetical protein
MEAPLSDLLFRPLQADELDLFNRYRTPPTAGVGARSRSFDEFVARGDYRPEWTWVALRGGEVVARAAFWAPPGFSHPFSLDWFDPGVGPDRVEVGAALVRAMYDAVATLDDGARPIPRVVGRTTCCSSRPTGGTDPTSAPTRSTGSRPPNGPG